jgi:hypothetical protein
MSVTVFPSERRRTRPAARKGGSVSASRHVPTPTAPAAPPAMCVVEVQRHDRTWRVFSAYATKEQAEAVARRLREVHCPARVQS